MNKGKLEYDKNAHKSLGAEDGDAEVFVLPPNLLQRLGIDLGNVKPSQDRPTDTDVVMTDSYVINKQHQDLNDDYESSEKESSILETANLMKKSVFLSPTFVPTPENSLPGELEISNLQSEKSNSTIKLSIDQDEIRKDIIEHVMLNGLHTIDKINVQIETKFNTIMPEKLSHLDNQIFHKSNDNVQRMNQLPFINNVGGNIITDVLETNEHPDETYSLDYNSSNQEPIENINTLDIPKVHSFNSDAQTKSNKEINILSEEILGPIQLKEVKCLHTSHVSNLIPINIKAFITANKIIENNGKAADTAKIVPNNSNQTLQYVIDTPINRSCQKNSEDALEYNDKGNIIPCTSYKNEVVSTEKLPVNAIPIDTVVQEKYIYEEHNLITSKGVKIASSSSNMSLIDKSINKNTDGQSSDNGFGVCLDTVVTDVEKDLEDDAKILDILVNEINSFDGDAILDEIKSNRKGKTNMSDSKKDTLQTSTHVKTLTSNHKIDFQNSNCRSSHSKDIDCINKEAILTCINQNSVDSYITGLPNNSKPVGIVGNKPVNTQTEDKINDIFKNSRKTDSLNSLKNSVPISIATQKSNKQIKIMDPHDGFENYQPENKDSLSHTAGNCRRDVNLNMTYSNNMDDKVKIISDYLSRCTHLYSHKRKLQLRPYTNSKKVCINQSNHSALNLKLCIEGVEKPGGPEESEQNSKKSRVLKTYGRNNKRKLPCSSTLPTGVPQVQSQINTSNNILNLSNNIGCSKNRKSEEFCLCGDFGRLAYYDCESIYEHIHFWDHQNLICNPEILYSLYDEQRQINNENVNLLDENVLNMTNNDLDETTTTGHTICWNNLDHHNIVHKNLKISRDVVSENLISETKECIINVDHTTNRNKSINMLVAQITDQHEDTVKFTYSTNLVDTKTEDTPITKDVSGITVAVADAEQYQEAVQVKNLLNPVEVTPSVSTPILGLNVSGITVVVADAEQYQQAVQVKNLLNPVEVTPSVSTTILDLKNTEQHLDILPLKEVIDSDNARGSNTDMETDDHMLHEYSEPKEIIVDNQMTEKKIDDKNASNLQSSDVNLKMTAEEIAATESKRKGKKRKKSKNQQDENVKKTVKCGVCEHLLVEAEWEDHIDNQHCFIAWKAGECIDFQDQELSKKLHQRLNSGSSLKCTFCDVEIKTKSKYLSHVQKCLKLKDSSDISTTESANEVIGSTLKCGVCEQIVIADDHWIKHISEEHNYLAWKAGEPALALDDEEAVRRHLSDIVKQFGALICCKCGLSRKYGKTYLHHIKNCTGKGEILDNTTNYIDVAIEMAASQSSDDVKCGVCAQVITAANWIRHIAKEHDYLAWKDGDPPLNLNDEEQIRQHLYTIAKQFGGLNCSKCGLNRKYVKNYLQHLNNCNVRVANDDSMDNPRRKNELSVKCGVCQKQIDSEMWMTHIQKYHYYLAWRDGEESLNIENSEEVQSHLYQITKEMGGLTCSKCGIVKKYVKSFLSHIETCDATPRYEDIITSDNIKCGVCLEIVSGTAWKAHRMEKHYNVAWALGDPPIDIKNPYAVERFLKEYKEYANKLVCVTCGISRVSYMGFYAHVVVCGKTDEETEIHKSVCNICNKKYLCIYQNQHMTMHREQAYAKERKLKKESELKVVVKDEVEDGSPSGRRRAAEKANIVIQNYKSNEGQYQHVCSTCGFGTDSSAELASHRCETASGHFSDSDASVKIEGEESEDESLQSDIDSEISDEEAQVVRKRNKHYPAMSSTVKRMPFTIKTPSSYLVKSGEEFSKFHFTDESLFPAWRACEHEPVPDDQLQTYLPPLEQSCNVRICDGVWNIHNRFEAKKDKVCSVFVGASIQCVTWAPPRCDQECDNFLAVACHRGTDCPRLAPDDIQRHAGLIQIWDYGDFKQLPKLVFGLAHDFGTVWSMDWCPSGSRDAPGPTEASDSSRLGLLAVACSTGSAYIFSVPYPSTLTHSDNLFHKLKPVVELRLSMGAHRTAYHATCLSWSPQKGHSLVVVGYGDGTTAFYDLNTDSPLLKTKENNVTILYPYHDERPHNSCVTGVDVYPSSVGAGAGAVCSSAPTGAGVAARPDVRAVRLQSHLAASVAMFQPHWPSAILAGDDSVVSAAANELEWWGGGRRFGPVRACCGCVWCARVALSTPPVLRLARPHPAYTDRKKRTIGCLQMVPTGRKRKKLADDQLATKIEPLSYEEAVKKYGIELKLDKNFQVPSSQSRDQFPERFPLADVPSMAFCPTAAHHSRLAVATHAGIVFIITL